MRSYPVTLSVKKIDQDVIFYYKNTVFTRLSAAALFKFSELQMWRSFGGGAQSGAVFFKKILFVNDNKNF
jgi:hypothetical protein